MEFTLEKQAAHLYSVSGTKGLQTPHVTSRHQSGAACMALLSCARSIGPRTAP